MNERFEQSTNFVVARGPIPKRLQAGKLHVNIQGTRAHHLCACGCAQRVMTPLNDIEWELSGSDDRPTLRPSVGNWNLDCKSHYFISNGKVRWARSFSPSEIEAVRRKDLKPYKRPFWVQKVVGLIERIIRFLRGG